MDGSKQSKHSNAYVAGMLGTKRIVIYDTLVTDLDGDIDMIKSVVGHEIGHSIEHHQWVLLVTSLVNFFILFWTYGFFQNTPSVVTSFGFKEVNTYLSLRCFMTGMHCQGFSSSIGCAKADPACVCNRRASKGCVTN